MYASICKYVKSGISFKSKMLSLIFLQQANISAEVKHLHTRACMYEYVCISACIVVFIYNSVCTRLKDLEIMNTSVAIYCVLLHKL